MKPAHALAHAWDFMDLMCTLVIGWQWLRMAVVAARALPAAGAADEAFYRGKVQAARYWLNTELPRIAQLAELCASGEDSYVAMRDEWF
jgi:butyryl-CoA dehydrogenase